MTTPPLDAEDAEPRAQFGCDLDVAAGFLDRWAESDQGRHLLLSILPDTFHPQGKTFDWPADRATALGWIEQCGVRCGLYWTVNVCRPNLIKKARKRDVQLLRVVWADLDPLDALELGDQRGDLESERERLYALAWELEKHQHPPTVVIDSGNGIQPIWRLADALEANDEYVPEIERLGRRIECALGGLENTSNVDRVLRVPGTTNFPNARKRGLGRVPMPTRILFETGHRYSWADLMEVAARLEDAPPEHAVPVEYRERGYTNGCVVHLDGVPDYPTEEQIEALLENHPNLRAIWDQTTLYPPEDTSPSGWDQSFASTLAALGLPPERVASYLRAYRAHHSPEKGKQDRIDYILRTVERAQPADAHLGEAREAAGGPGDRPPEDAPPHQAGQCAGASSSDGDARQHQTAGDAQGRNRGTFSAGRAQPKPPDWPEPGELGKPDPAPEFPTRLLPTCLRQWVETQAENMGVPADLLAVPGIVTIAGCIGRRATLRAKRHDWSWVERPCLWAAIIAPKGSLKSPALALATAPLRAAEARHRKRWQADLEAWEARQERSRNGQIKVKQDDPKPLEPKLVMTNATIEAMADAMVESRGLTMVRDELSGWVNNMSRYSKGDDRQFYLECHSGGAYAVDRIVRGRQIVPDIYLNVVGGIQPKVARKAFQISEDGADDGFFERFGLICYPDLSDWQGVRDVPLERDYKDLVMQACIRLADKDWPMILGDRPMIFEGNAQDGFLDWYDRHMAGRVATKVARDRADHGFMSKGPGLVLRLAIVIHLFRWTCGEFDGPCVVDLVSLKAAIGIFETYCVPMYGRVCHAFAQVRAQSGAERIAAMILEKKMDRVRFGDVTKRKWPGLREREDVLQALAVLEDIDWLAHPGMGRSGPKGGRPTDAWLVNPKVLR
jgi:hypothetical protein